MKNDFFTIYKKCTFKQQEMFDPFFDELLELLAKGRTYIKIHEILGYGKKDVDEK